MKIKEQVGNIIANSLKEQVKNIRKLTKEERELINYYGIKQINNEIRGVSTLDNDKLLQIWNVDLKDTYEVLEKNKDNEQYNYKFRLSLLKSFEKQVKNELIKRKLI